MCVLCVCGGGGERGTGGRPAAQPCSSARHSTPNITQLPYGRLPLQELLVSPQLLASHAIPVVKVVHHPREFVVVYPGAYHR